MARTVLEVVVAADAKQMERGLARAGKATDKFGKDAEKNLGRATVGIRGIGKAAGAAGAALAGAGLVSGIRSLTDAAAESEKSNVRMRAQLKASGLSFASYGKRIEEVIQKQSRLAALDDEELQDAFTNIVRSTGNVEKSLKLVGLASDLARAKQMDVARAGDIVAKVAAGNTGILSRYGVTIEKGATATEALAAMQQKFGGQARAYGQSNAAAMERFGVASENLKESLGAQLLPVLADGANRMTGFLTQMQNGTGAGGRFAEVAREIAGGFQAVGKEVGPPLRSIGRFVEKNPEVTKMAGGLLAVGAAAKAIRFGAALTGVDALAKGLGRLGAGPGRAIGRRVSDGLLEAFGGRRAAMRAAMSSTLTSAGASAGASAGTATGAAVAGGVAGDANRRSMSRAGRLMGRSFGAALSGAALAGVVGLGTLLARKVNDEFTDVLDDLFGGSKSGRNAGHDSLRPGPLKLLEDIVGVGDGPGKGQLKSRVRKAVGSLPTGGSPSASLRGANSALMPFARIGFANGLGVTSGKRAAGGRTSSGGISYHGSGEAIDLSGPHAGMMRTFQALKSRYGSRLAELIYTPGGTGIKNGRPYSYGGKVAADHYDHVHVAFDLGARGPGLGSFGGNRTGDGYGAGALRSLAKGVGLSDSESITAAAVALAESGGNPRASNRNSNGSIDRGLWQINSVHGALSTFDVAGNARAMAKISRGGSNWRPWVAYTSGSYRKFLGAARSARPSSTSRSSARTGPMVAKVVKGGAAPALPLSPAAQRKQDAAQAAADYAAQNPVVKTGPGGAPIISPGIGAPTGPSVAEFLQQQATARREAKYDAANATLALAGLTEGTDDDLAALQNLAGITAADLELAKARGDNRDIIDLAGQLKSLNDQIGGLRADAQAVAAAIDAARADNERALKEQAQREARLSQSQYGVLAKAISEVANGTLGGRVGLGFQSVGWAGGGVRYAASAV